MEMLTSTNPAREYEVLGSVNISTENEIKEKVDSARRAFEKWKSIGIDKRIDIIKPLYGTFSESKEDLALLESKEIGKPIKEALSDIDFYLGYLNDYLENGKEYLKSETVKADGCNHLVQFEPIGVAVVISPWNYPFGNFIWGVIPNLIAGNSVIFKHSEECPLMGKKMENIMETLVLPYGVFSEIYGNGVQGQFLVEQDIDIISFTGSSKIGRKLYEIAGKKFIRSVMELGGSNPGIVFEDVNSREVALDIYEKRFSNCGQMCDAIKRLIVHESVFSDIVDELRKVIDGKIVGDPGLQDTNLGSLVSKKQLEFLASQVEDAKENGAKVVTGGKIPKDVDGAYYLPTILIDITRNMRVWKEEVFGPVLPVISFRTENEAIEIADETEYGLGATIYSKNVNRAKRVAEKIDAGSIEINTASRWSSASIPYGGNKFSGIGREHGKHGFRELCKIKVISI